MRKLITILSVVSALGFAAALAATNDATNTNPTDTTSDMSGTAGNTSASNPSSETGSTTSSTTKKNDKWASAKKCTDENGVTYYKGKTGFQSCVDKMRKQEQMGGTSPSESTKTEGHSSSDTPQE